MRKQIFTLLCACLMSGMLFAQSTWFNDKDLALTGVYYYPANIGTKASGNATSSKCTT